MPEYEILHNLASPKHSVSGKNAPLEQRKSDDNENSGDKGGR